MTLNVDRAVEVAQKMTKKADEISVKTKLRGKEVREIEALLTAGAAQLSQMCSGLLLMVKQQEAAPGPSGPLSAENPPLAAFPGASSPAPLPLDGGQVDG